MHPDIQKSKINSPVKLSLSTCKKVYAINLFNKGCYVLHRHSQPFSSAMSLQILVARPDFSPSCVRRSPWRPGCDSGWRRGRYCCGRGNFCGNRGSLRRSRSPNFRGCREFESPDNVIERHFFPVLFQFRQFCCLKKCTTIILSYWMSRHRV